jgi:deoxyribodipyrimidine photo-lyase
VVGDATEAVPHLCGESADMYVTSGVCSEETTDEKRMDKQLKARRGKLNKVWGNTLYMPDDCGCAANNIPLLFTSFKNKAESRGRIRNPCDASKVFPRLPTPSQDDIKKDLDAALKFMPTLEELGYPADEAAAAMQDDPRGVMKFQGGEEAALQRLQKWMFEDDNLKDYFNIRNGMLGEGYSSKLSPWLALGCISPRRIWLEAQRYEQQRVKNKSTYWLVFELTWRDFYIYLGLSQGDKLFVPGGVSGERMSWKGSKADLENWKAGKTGDQLVDANMRELEATGFMSNRGRQNVASYLIFDLGVDWRYGAAHFEEKLLDHDPCSNWGNWVAAAGLTGQRVNKFNTRKQLSDYDPKREYVNHWLQRSGSTSPSSKMDTYIDGAMEADRQAPKEHSKGYGGKGNGKGGKGGQSRRDNDDVKRRRWQARNERSNDWYA